jgi:hypothetical protein
VNGNLMKKLVTMSLVLAALVSGALAVDRPAEGMAVLDHLEALPVFHTPGTKTIHFGNYDVVGGNDKAGETGRKDDPLRYAGNNNFWSFWTRCYTDRKEMVIVDAAGPGCIYRQQFNVWGDPCKLGPGFISNPENRIRFYFDDETTPRIDLKINEYFGCDGKYTAPVNPPFVLIDKGGPNPEWANSYYPLPFARRLRVALELKQKDPLEANWGKWFQFTGIKVVGETPVATWTGTNQAENSVRGKFSNCGSNPKAVKTTAVTNRVTVATNATEVLFAHNGAGSIQSLRLTVQPYNETACRNMILRIQWDGATNAAVEMPLGAFFGAAGEDLGHSTGLQRAGESALTQSFAGSYALNIKTWNRQLKNLLFGFDGAGSFYSYWPMPFWKSARISIENRSGVETRVVAEVERADEKDLPYDIRNTGYFCARQRVDVSPDAAYYSSVFDEKGHGKVVGLTFFSQGFEADGDLYVFADGSLHPIIHGSGSEDDLASQGWGGRPVQQPLTGALINGYQGSYRIFAGDSIYFYDGIRILLEHSNEPFGRTVRGQRTLAVVWYYRHASHEEGRLKLCDEFAVGDAAAEKAHAYRIAGQTWSGVTTSHYDRLEQQLDPKDLLATGRAHKGESSFVMKIQPDNAGVRLRKRISRFLGDGNVQFLDVYVDGEKLESPWLISELRAREHLGTETLKALWGKNGFTLSDFADVEYEIPARYTKGKKKLGIRLVYREPAGTDLAASKEYLGANEYHYWAFTY